MKRRQFIKIAGAAALSFPQFGFGRDKDAAGQPNILFVFSDQHRASAMGCVGDPNVHTPNFDAFAAQGLRLDAAYSSTPVCCPYRASLMTGQFGHHNGMISNYMDFFPEGPLLGATFRTAGYSTGYVGKWHLNFPRAPKLDRTRYGDAHPEYTPPDRRLGFEWWRGSAANNKFFDYAFFMQDDLQPTNARGIYQPTVIANQAIGFIQEKSKMPAPWFLMVSWTPPHTPYEVPERFRENYKDRKITLSPNVPSGDAQQYARENLRQYYPMVEAVDEEFGRILKVLEDLKLTENTIVIYTADHGDMLGSYGYVRKRWPHDESSRVPFLIRYPGKLIRGEVIKEPFGTTDIFPTLAGLTGLAVPQGLDGADYSAFLQGKTSAPPRDYAYMQMMYGYVPWPGWRAIRTRSYLFAATVKGPWFLFDVDKDPDRIRNLVDEKSSGTLVNEMDKRLAELMKDCGDSWEIAESCGDIKNWLIDGKKRDGSDLGIDWPGKQGWNVPANAGTAD